MLLLKSHFYSHLRFFEKAEVLKRVPTHSLISFIKFAVEMSF